MYCNTCGQEVSQDSRFCDNCGAAIEPQVAGLQNEPQYEPQYAPGMPYQDTAGSDRPVDVPNYLVQSILATVFSLVCCGIIGCIPGAVAIVFSTQVNSKLNSGDYAGAVSSSRNAKTWSWVAIGLGILGAVVGLIVVLFLGLAGVISGLQ